uniref:THO complex subunit 7 homolog n=1 Tax=Elaeophora elaphi TaxID=1147741 RepID=A0A0R3RI06_9BILA
MHSANDVERSTEIKNNVVVARAIAKRLAGMIRRLKEQIINELNIWQGTNAENCQLEINIHHFQQRLKELDVLCINYETSNAEIRRRKKRYSEQLTKISKLISEQNFDAANWAIILDEIAFVNRELFDILISTATAERRALQMEAINEEKYRIVAEKLVLKRMELRQELYSQMNSYESLRAKINQTETNLTNLQKTIDVYDAEYWQLDDARQDLQSQIFQLQELLHHSQRHCHFGSPSKSSSSKNDNSDKDENAEYKNNKCSTMEQKNNVMIVHRMVSKKNYDVPNAKDESEMISKTTKLTIDDITDKRTESRKSAIESEHDVKFRHGTLPLSRKVSRVQFPVSPGKQTRKESEYSKSDKLTGIAPLLPDSARDGKFQKSLINSKSEEKISEEDDQKSDQESTTALQSSNEKSAIDSSKLSSLSVTDGESVDLTSESISLSDISEKTDAVSAIEKNNEEHVKKVFQ